MTGFFFLISVPLYYHKSFPHSLPQVQDGRAYYSTPCPPPPVGKKNLVSSGDSFSPPISKPLVNIPQGYFHPFFFFFSLPLCQFCTPFGGLSDIKTFY